MLPVYIPLASIEKTFSFENIIRLLTGETERMSRDKLQSAYFVRFFFQASGNAVLEEVFSDVNSYAFLTMPLRKSGTKYYLTAPTQTQAVLYYLSLNENAVTEFFYQITAFLIQESDQEKVSYLLSKLNRTFILNQFDSVGDNPFFHEYWDYYLQMLECHATNRAVGLLILFSVLNIDAYYLLSQFRGDILFSEHAAKVINPNTTYVMQSALNTEMFLGIQTQRNMNDIEADVLCTIGRGELSKQFSCFTFEPIPRKNTEHRYDASDGIDDAKSHDQSAFTLLEPLGAMEGVIRNAVQATSYDESDYGLYYIKVNGKYLQLVNSLLHTQITIGEMNESSKWKIIFHDGWVSIKPWADIPLNVFALDVPNGRRLPGTAIWLFFKHDTLSQHFKLYQVLDKSP